jgi:hypothetical protein
MRVAIVGSRGITDYRDWGRIRLVPSSTASGAGGSARCGWRCSASRGGMHIVGSRTQKRRTQHRQQQSSRKDTQIRNEPHHGKLMIYE